MKFISKVDSDDVKLGKVYDGEIIGYIEKMVSSRKNIAWVSIKCEDGKYRLFDIKNLQSLSEFRENILNQLLN